MLFFKCRISHNELLAVRKHLPSETFCITKDPKDTWYYGVITASVFDLLLNVLSGETLEQLEYLNEHEFRDSINPFKDQHTNFHGNTDLLN